jgi:hypothetical protein
LSRAGIEESQQAAGIGWSLPSACPGVHADLDKLKKIIESASYSIRFHALKITSCTLRNFHSLFQQVRENVELKDISLYVDRIS